MVFEALLMVGLIAMFERILIRSAAEEFTVSWNTAAFWIHFIFAIGAVFLVIFTKQNYFSETIALCLVFFLNAVGVLVAGVRALRSGGF